jgi:hypothetical protein
VISRRVTHGRYGANEELVLKVEAGTAHGDRLAPGDWLSVRCSPAVLAQWLKRDDPQPGDRVTIFYGGIDMWKSRSRHEYVAGIASRADSTNGAESFDTEPAEPPAAW